MSINGVQNTSFPLTLSGLTLTDDLSGTYVPYTGAISAIDLNNQAVSNVASLAVVGAVSSTSVSATGAVSGASIASTGAITGTSLTITEAGIGKKFLAGEYFNVPVIQVLNSTQVAINFYAPAYPSIFPIGTVIKIIGFPVQTILNTTYTVVSAGSWSAGIAFVYASFSGLPVGFYYGDLTTYMYKYDDVTYGNLGGINLFCVNTVTGDYLWARNQALLNNMTATGITSISGTGNITSTNLTATGTVSTATLTATGTTTLATTNVIGNSTLTGIVGITGPLGVTGNTSLLGTFTTTGIQSLNAGAYGSSGDYIDPTTNIRGSTEFDGGNIVNIQCQASQYGRNILYLTGRAEGSPINDAWSFVAPRNAISFRTQATLNATATNRFTIQNFFQELGILSAGKSNVPITKWANDGTMTHTDNMTIGGTVGIGNTAPLYALTVGTGSGTVMTSIIRMQDGYYTNGQYGIEMRGIDNGINGHDLQFWGRQTASGAFNNIVTIKNTGTIASMKTTTGVPTLGIWGGTGDRIVLYQGSASAYPYSIGINSSEMWFLIPGGSAYRWYSGVSTMMVLDNFQLGINILSPLCRLDVSGSANIWTGTRYAVPNGFMALGSLTIGSITQAYGGGSNWNTNTAGFMLETSGSQEIMVHHSGVRLASLLYYSTANDIYIC